jgi:N-acetylmuramoyl-L-alanine amidase
MSKINTFLQKRKMHENRYGILMVIIAYVLSIFMLFLGSDVFYNIKSAAAGIKNETDEATLETLEEGELDQKLADLRAEKLQAKYTNAKALYASCSFGASILNSENVQPGADTSGDIIWLLGRSMNAKEYDTLLEQIGDIKETKKQSNDNKDMLAVEEDGTGNSKKNTEKKDGSIKSLSVKNETVTDSKESASDKAVDSKAGTSDKAKNNKESASDKRKKTEDTKKSEEAKEANGAYVYDVTDKEIEMLERIVQAEAGSEDIKGRILVANVVLNRVSHKNFPDTIKKVIFQSSDGDYQFSPVADKRYWSVKVSKKTKEAVDRALQGEDYSEGALYFMARKRARKSNAKWFDNNLKWLFKHGGHEFYK